MSLRIRALLTLVILAVIAACGQQVAVPPSKTQARPLAAVPAAQRANYFKTPPPMTIDAKKTYVATITTSKGNIVVSLDANAAPQTVNNFVFLANQGFYDGLTFHRVEPGFVIQGGDPLGSGGGGPGYTVPAEIKLPHVEGAIAMARTSDQVNPKRESSGCQFYITLAPTPFLDGAYTAFGKVTQGMDVVKKIAKGDVIQQIAISGQ
jgi:cyclophilin family peptidyl-prolyl cis-trans isomerase